MGPVKFCYGFWLYFSYLGFAAGIFDRLVLFFNSVKTQSSKSTVRQNTCADEKHTIHVNKEHVLNQNLGCYNAMC